MIERYVLWGALAFIAVVLGVKIYRRWREEQEANAIVAAEDGSKNYSVAEETGDKIQHMIIAFGMLGASLVCAAVVVSHLYTHFKFRDGIHAAATVNYKYTVNRLGNNPRYNTWQQWRSWITHYTLNYTFKDANAVTHQGHADVGTDFYSSHNIHDTIDVRYLPNNPEESIVAGSDDPKLNYIAYFVPFLNLIFIGYMAFIRRDIDRDIDNSGHIDEKPTHYL